MASKTVSGVSQMAKELIDQKMFKSAGTGDGLMYDDGMSSGGYSNMGVTTPMVYCCAAPQNAVSFNAGNLNLTGQATSVG